MVSGSSRPLRKSVSRQEQSAANTPTAAANSNSVHFTVNEIAWAWFPEDETWRRALVIATDRASAGIPRPVEAQAAGKEAYIHYKGLDRRLDTWVGYNHLRKLDTGRQLAETVCWSDGESDDAHAGMDTEYLKEHQEHTKYKTINKIRMGNHEVDCWYFSPYPCEVQHVDKLHICPFCLSFFKHNIEYVKHGSRCTARHPPGNEIYRDDERKISMWEIDGGICRIYCENICFLSKLFLDHKTLRHPVNLFLFYVLTEMRTDGYHIVGYFSKEKYSRNNLSCVLILPQYQKRGFGKYLINFSYALALKEGRRGTPERPLSDLGQASYLNYWRQTLLLGLGAEQAKYLIVNETADRFSFEPQDIVHCLTQSDMLLREPVTANPFIYLTPEHKHLLSAKLGHPPPPIDPARLQWLPYDPFLGPFEYSSEL